MDKFLFRVNPHHDITVELNSKLIFVYYWHDEMTIEENILAAVRATKRLCDDMNEQGKRAAEEGIDHADSYC